MKNLPLARSKPSLVRYHCQKNNFRHFYQKQSLCQKKMKDFYWVKLRKIKNLSRILSILKNVLFAYKNKE